MKEEIDTKITFSKPNNGDNEKIRIKLEDKNGVIIVQTEISLENFASAITGSAAIPCVSKMCENINIINKERENKSVAIDISDANLADISNDNFEKFITKKLQSYKEGCWQINPYYIKSFNSHYVCKKQGKTLYTIPLYRYI